MLPPTLPQRKQGLATTPSQCSRHRFVSGIPSLRRRFSTTAVDTSNCFAIDVLVDPEVREVRREKAIRVEKSMETRGWDDIQLKLEVDNLLNRYRDTADWMILGQESIGGGTQVFMAQNRNADLVVRHSYDSRIIRINSSNFSLGTL